MWHKLCQAITLTDIWMCKDFLVNRFANPQLPHESFLILSPLSTHLFLRHLLVCAFPPPASCLKIKGTASPQLSDWLASKEYPFLFLQMYELSLVTISNQVNGMISDINTWFWLTSESQILEFDICVHTYLQKKYHAIYGIVS